MQILVCPDKFKDSLTAPEVAQAIQKALPKDAKTILVPMADGGEGSLQVVAATTAGKWKTVFVNDPLFRPILAKYYLSGTVAYIEMARASGYELLKNTERNCGRTTTFGTGELIRDAIDEGVSEICLFVGGSATNDGGMGVAAALGYRFLDRLGNELVPVGDNLLKVRQMRSPKKRPFTNVKCTVVCDVINPFHGVNGAAHVFAAQKGATVDQITDLDNGLRNLARIIRNELGVDLQQFPGSGAAGGLGGGAVAFLNAEMKSGTQTLIEFTGLEERIKSSDLVITGEGKVDVQSISGKLIDGICQIARQNHVPVWVICGSSEISQAQTTALGIGQMLTLTNESTSATYAINNAAQLITERIFEAFQNI